MKRLKRLKRIDKEAFNQVVKKVKKVEKVKSTHVLPSFVITHIVGLVLVLSSLPFEHVVKNPTVLSYSETSANSRSSSFDVSEFPPS